MNKTSLKSVSKLITKGTTPTTVGGEFLDSGINFVKSESVGQFKHLDSSLFQFIDKETDEKLKRSRLLENDLLFSIAGAYLGKLSIVSNSNLPANTNQAVGIVRLDFEKVNVNYLYYYFSQRAQNDYINNLSSQSSQPNLNLTLLGELNFDLKSIKEQNKIAKILSDIDAKIELNNKINTELEAMAKLIYDYWFVQFDFPDKNGKPYKSSGGKMVYNKELKREIPEGWEVKALKDWIKNDKSGDWGKESEEGNYDSKVSCIRGADINGLNGKGEVKSPTRFILEKNSHKLLEVGDLIIEISGGSPTQSTGRMAFMTKETMGRFENPLICSNFCKAVTLKEEKALFNFVYLWNRLYDAGVLFGWEGKTSGIKNLLFESFVSKHKTPKPPKELMVLFHDKMKPIHAQIQKNLQQNQKLAELRDWLLPMLMNGQVKVGEVEEQAQLNMAAEPEVSYGKKSIEKEEQAFLKRKVLASYIINHSLNDNYFGNVKFEKLLHLADYHAVQRNLGQKYLQQAAGPYDNTFTYAFFTQVEKAKWFKRQNLGNLKKIVAGEDHDKSTNTYNYFSDEELKKVDNLINKFKNSNYEQPEIVSTLYAVWNNRIIKQEPITDELLKQDFLKWDQQKAKYKDRLDDALKWMRKEDLIPQGWGPIIEKSKKK